MKHTNNIFHLLTVQSLFLNQPALAGSNKPNTLSTSFRLIYNSERVINQWCEIHANDPTESNKSSIIISHFNNQFFYSVRCRIAAAQLGSCGLLVNTDTAQVQPSVGMLGLSARLHRFFFFFFFFLNALSATS